jgi:hypothetical protein
VKRRRREGRKEEKIETGRKKKKKVKDKVREGRVVSLGIIWLSSISSHSTYLS